MALKLKKILQMRIILNGGIKMSLVNFYIEWPNWEEDGKKTHEELEAEIAELEEKSKNMTEWEKVE